MKFIKYAVGLVIALSVIPLVVITVNNLDQPKLRTIEFEVVDYDTDNSLITFSDNALDLIKVLNIVDNDEVTNLVSVKVNNVIIEDVSLSYYGAYELIGYWLTDTTLNEVTDDGYFSSNNGQIGDKWEMTFEVPRPLPPLIKTLVGFAPLLLIGGILLFMLNKRKLA